jgi:predicted metal-dependent enzyme (double-stranded beta helix superfamily)
MEERGLDDAVFSRRAVLAAAGGLLALPACRGAAKSPAPESAARSDAMDAFVADCVAASQEPNAQQAVREVLARGVSDPRAMLHAVGEPTQAGLKVFHRSQTLTIFAATWTPQMTLMPHNHLMWALIGIYTGREDNILWRRTNARLQAHGAQCLFEGDVATLPADAIHSVTNPLERFTGGLHIYGGDFFATTRSQWNPETLAEEPSDGDVIRGIFERANARMQRLRGA